MNNIFKCVCKEDYEEPDCDLGEYPCVKYYGKFISLFIQLFVAIRFYLQFSLYNSVAYIAVHLFTAIAVFDAINFVCWLTVLLQTQINSPIYHRGSINAS